MSKVRILALALLLAAFAAIVAWTEHSSHAENQAKALRYGQFLANSLWNLDNTATRDHALLVCGAEGYLEMRVLHLDGTPFVVAQGRGLEGPLDRFLSRMGIMRVQTYHSPINYKGTTIGNLLIMAPSRNVYNYFYYLLVLLLLTFIVHYYLRVLEDKGKLEAQNSVLGNEIGERLRVEQELENHKQLLERRVSDRTKDLYDANKRLWAELAERKKAETALRESEEQYRLLADHVRDVIWVLDLDDLRFSYISPSVYQMRGYTAEEAMCQTLHDCLTPESVKKAMEFLAMELSQDSQTDVDADRQARMELQQKSRDGSILWTEVMASFLRDADGTPRGVLGVTRDITQRRRAEQELRDSERRYRIVLDTSPEPIMVMDAKGNITYINPAFTEVFGWDLQGIKEAAWEFVPPHLRDRVRDSMRQVLRQGMAVGSRESLRITKSGEVLDVMVNAAAFRDDQGRLMGLVSTLKDITERKRWETALLESEERYRGLFENIEDLVYTFELDGTITSANPRAVAKLGFQPEELLGRNLSEFFPTRRNLENHRKAMEVLREQGALSGLVPLLGRDGQLHYMEFRSILVSKPGGEPYVSGTGRDVTERIMAQQELTRLEEQLRQAQKMEAVGRLAGGIAHDFNNILQAISGYVQIMLVRQDAASQEAAYLGEVDKAIGRAADLVTRLLTFSRKVEPQLRLLDINQEVRQAVGLLERIIPKMITIRTDLEEGAWPVSGDPNQVEQIIMNLCTNARDAMPGGGTLTISSHNRHVEPSQASGIVGLEPGDYVCISVTDDGRGIDPEFLPHIFEPFFTTKEVGQGTGLGLATVYGIVMGHQGHIDCQSHVGRGTTFTIFLPAMPDMELTESRPEAAPREIPGGRETVLLVDDEEPILEVTGSMLRQVGYTILTCSSGEEALDIYAVQGNDIDLVILDLGMPGMGGERCLELLLETDPQVKVLIASGYSAGSQPHDILTLGAKGYITKPYRLEEIVRIVRRILDES